MNVKLKAELCISNNCSKIKFTDNTGLYNNTTNVNGWSNTLVVGNLLLSQIIEARMTMVKLGETSIISFPLKSLSVNLYPIEATPEFSFTEFDWTGGDGIYTFTYEVRVTLPDIITNYTANILITCEAEQCLNKLWVKYAESGKDVDKEKAIEASALLKGAKALYYCNGLQSSASVIKTLTKICKISNEDCGC